MKTARRMNQGNIDEVPCRTNRISGRIRWISRRRTIVAPISSCGVDPDRTVRVAVREVRVSGIPNLPPRYVWGLCRKVPKPPRDAFGTFL